MIKTLFALGILAILVGFVLLLVGGIAATFTVFGLITFGLGVWVIIGGAVAAFLGWLL